MKRKEYKMKTYRPLNEQEMKWIKKVLDNEFLGKEILLEQVSQSQVSVEKERGYVSIIFEVSGNVEQYPYTARVLVEMHAFQEAEAPIVFLLHVIDGLVNELEIYSADGSDIHVSTISLDRVEHVMDEEVVS